MQREIAQCFVVAALLAGVSACVGDRPNPTTDVEPGRDPHETAAGYFDLHICNWPDRPPFVVALFATADPAKVRRIEVLRPDGRLLGEVRLTTFERRIDEHGHERRAYKTFLPLPKDAPAGWYRARVTLRDGSVLQARDFLQVQILPQAQIVQPANGQDNLARVAELRWRPVPGASHYRVFIKDAWAGEQVYKSDLLTEPRLRLPPGVLQPNGSYVWRVHARSGASDETKWGEFNHGSLNTEASFALAGS